MQCMLYINAIDVTILKYSLMHKHKKTIVKNTYKTTVINQQNYLLELQS